MFFFIYKTYGTIIAIHIYLLNYYNIISNVFLFFFFFTDPACYVKNTTSTISPKTSSFEVTLEGTTGVTSEFGNSTASPISDTAKSESGRTGQEILMTIAIVFGVIFPSLLPLAVIYIFCKNREIEFERTDENVESHVHHQENENGSTGENGNKN